MLNNASLEQLVKIANELDSRRLMKESDEIDALIKMAEPITATIFGVSYLTAAIIAAVAGTTAAVGVSKASEDAMSVFETMGVTDLTATPAGDLWESFRTTLTQADLIDGPGSFPAGKARGGTFVREIFDVRMKKMMKGDFENIKIDEKYFQDNIYDYWGANAATRMLTGLDNENGWVDAWNVLVDIFEEQYKAAEKIKDLMERESLTEEQAVRASQLMAEKEMSEKDAVAAVMAAGGAAAVAAPEGAAPEGAAPPPIPETATMHYHGPSGQAKLSVEEIAAKVSEDINARHLVWTTGWPGWKKWDEIPSLAAMVQDAPPPPPVPSAVPMGQPSPISTQDVNELFGTGRPQEPQYSSMEEAIAARTDEDEDLGEALKEYEGDMFWASAQ